jgi:hypothetical protein
MGYLPQAMVNYLALLGWGDGTENEFFTIDDLGMVSKLCFLSFSLKYWACLVPGIVSLALQHGAHLSG